MPGRQALELPRQAATMEGARLKRIMREIASCERDKDDEITVQMIDGASAVLTPESPFHLLGTFPGPAHSPFESGLFKVDIVVPEGYPFHPLQMRFITKVYHPNVSSQSGAICLDILKGTSLPLHRPMVPGIHSQDHPHVAPIAVVLTGTQRSSRRRGGQALYQRPRQL